MAEQQQLSLLSKEDEFIVSRIEDNEFIFNNKHVFHSPEKTQCFFESLTKDFNAQFKTNKKRNIKYLPFL